MKIKRIRLLQIIRKKEFKTYQINKIKESNLSLLFHLSFI